MAVEHIHAYLVHPKKGDEDKSQLTGTDVLLSGKMFKFMDEIYSRSESDCDIDITFRTNSDGKQQNDFRDLLVSYLSKPSLITGQSIAERLGQKTDWRSALGLLFLIAGREQGVHKVVISRFPTDSAIYVEEQSSNLSVEFLERVFMKNKHSYKAVLYRDSSLQGGFWSGKAIDRQLNTPTSPTSDYWISDFLLSDFTVTSAHGTRRFARALRAAVQSDIPIDVKQELTAVATLSGGLSGQKLSIDEIIDRFNLSERAQAAILKELKKPALATEKFSFNTVEFKAIATFKSIDLDNGATLTAETDRFDVVFSKLQIGDQIEYTTIGREVDERLRIKS